MPNSSTPTRYTTIAEFELLIGEQSHRVSQIAPDYLILESPLALPMIPATLVIRVHGQEKRHKVTLHPPPTDPHCIPITR